MAFRLPPQAPARQRSISASQPPPAIEIPPSLSQVPENESTEWVLFSPSQAASTTARTHTTSTERTPRTTGASRISDFGSLGTPTRSAWAPEHDDTEGLDDPLDEDGTELDSLDDGLHAFRAPSPTQETSNRWDQGTPAILPTHDGLGSFHASSQTVQDQLWQHEQYNPRRRPDLRLRRHSSVQRRLDAVQDEEPTDAERDRWQRIEKWRMDQSRVLLQEIERETRRRRNSRVSGRSDRTTSRNSATEMPPGLLETPVLETTSERVCDSAAAESDADSNEPFWRRITRKVIRDLIGIDDSLLSVILGESLPPMEDDEKQSTASTDGDLNMEEELKRELDSLTDDSSLWQSKLLQRIAHELGVLVHQLCEHPGAFTTYLNMMNDVPNQYAGMPLSRLPEESEPQPSASVGPTEVASTRDSMMSPQFSPTLRDPNREHAAQWGIEDEDLSNRLGNSADLSEPARVQRDKDYWERELDVMMVFRYLRNRFGRRNGNGDAPYSPSRRSSQDASRRAAIIRQHHPLVARAHSRHQAQLRRQSQYSAASGPTGVSSPLLRQHFRRSSSSCASQSAKLSAISSRRSLTGSSRNYWDIGGSVDSGSAVARVGAGLGTWGDV
ncbi:hypothetical protein FE257_002758 [Aspergillus nanangensis]|uniref:Uncharacterized protein n=1 Tax=Aspergillus nanangensis TaxID=2582783 RepID=A0AAD4CCB8_ASPNN|nr:hypothetical protein FE257_002758 [Aspergillus nanangensis]